MADAEQGQQEADAVDALEAQQVSQDAQDSQEKASVEEQTASTVEATIDGGPAAGDEEVAHAGPEDTVEVEPAEHEDNTPRVGQKRKAPGSPEQQQGCGLNAEQTREFLDTLPRDKLVSLLTSIGATSPRAWQLIQQRARAPMKPAASAREQSAGAGTATPAPPESKRLFIRDLPYTLTSEGLNSAMEEFGPVEDAVVIQDRATGRSKGFGFITFKDVSSAKAALVQGFKDIGGRRAQINPATERGASGQGAPSRADGPPYGHVRDTGYRSTPVYAEPRHTGYASMPPQPVYSHNHGAGQHMQPSYSYAQQYPQPYSGQPHPGQHQPYQPGPHAYHGHGHHPQAHRHSTTGGGWQSQTFGQRPYTHQPHGSY